MYLTVTIFCYNFHDTQYHTWWNENGEKIWNKWKKFTGYLKSELIYKMYICVSYNTKCDFYLHNEFKTMSKNGQGKFFFFKPETKFLNFRPFF